MASTTRRSRQLRATPQRLKSTRRDTVTMRSKLQTEMLQPWPVCLNPTTASTRPRRSAPMKRVLVLTILWHRSHCQAWTLITQRWTKNTTTNSSLLCIQIPTGHLRWPLWMIHFKDLAKWFLRLIRQRPNKIFTSIMSSPSKPQWTTSSSLVQLPRMGWISVPTQILQNTRISSTRSLLEVPVLKSRCHTNT